MVRRAYAQRSVFEILLPDADKLWDPAPRIDALLDDEPIVDVIVDTLGRRHLSFAKTSSDSLRSIRDPSTGARL